MAARGPQGYGRGGAPITGSESAVAWRMASNWGGQPFRAPVGPRPGWEAASRQTAQTLPFRRNLLMRNQFMAASSLAVAGCRN